MGVRTRASTWIGWTCVLGLGAISCGGDDTSGGDGTGDATRGSDGDGMTGGPVTSASQTSGPGSTTGSNTGADATSNVDDTAGPSDDTAGSTGEPPWEGCDNGGGFAERPTPWAIPFASDQVFDGGTTINWTTTDYDGDGYIDLVNALGAPPVGQTVWEVYFGGPGGFAAQPHLWPVPFASDQVFDGGTTINWTVRDYDGDGLVDLVTALGPPPVGITEWSVYFGDGTGFAATPTSWAIPFASDQVFDGGTTINWTTTDYDGDGYIDLVNALGAPPVGQTVWEVYFGGPGGFAAQPHLWPVPFASDQVFDGGTTINWTVRDYDGDGLVDLVTALGPPPVGITEWSVYFGDGTGFAATPTSWAIPFASDQVFDGGTTINWTTTDYDGDGYIDLVNALGAPPVGQTVWEVYFGGPGGFAAQPHLWPVPFASDQVFDGGTTINWTIADYDGDHVVDLINGLGPAPVGVSQWDVYPGACAR